MFDISIEGKCPLCRQHLRYSIESFVNEDEMPYTNVLNVRIKRILFCCCKVKPTYITLRKDDILICRKKILYKTHNIFLKD